MPHNANRNVKVTFNVTPKWWLPTPEGLERIGRVMVAVTQQAEVARVTICLEKLEVVVFASDDVTAGSLEQMHSRLLALVESVR